jgi:hypothetical protein
MIRAIRIICEIRVQISEIKPGSIHPIELELLDEIPETSIIRTA